MLLAREPKWEQWGAGRLPRQRPGLLALRRTGQQPLLRGSQHRDQRPIPAEPTAAQPLCEARKRWLVHQVLHHRKAEVLEIVRRVKRAKRSHDRLLRPIRDDCAHRRGESGHRGQHPAYLPGCTSLPLLLSWRASGFKDQACQSVPFTDHVHLAVASQNTSGQLRKVPRQVLHDVLDIEWKPRGRVAIVAGNKRRAPFGDWEAMTVVASSHIDDPRWQGLVFQDDVHHACPMRCPCPLFRVSWAQPKGDSVPLPTRGGPGDQSATNVPACLRFPQRGNGARGASPAPCGRPTRKRRLQLTHANHPEGKAATRRLRGCGGNGEQATVQSHQCCGAGAEPYTSPP